jgi:hypothetical protein
MRRAFLEGVARAVGAELGALALDPKRRDRALARCRAFFLDLVDDEKRQQAGNDPEPPPATSPSVSSEKKPA